MSEWQPAETAPLGEWVFVRGLPWGKDSPPLQVGRCSEVAEERWEKVSAGRMELISETVREWDVEGLAVDEWLPLSALPQGEDE